MRLHPVGVLACAVALALAGCEANDFRPLDARRGIRPELAAAQYDIELEGRDVGDAKVWSMGQPKHTEEMGLPGDPAGLLQVGVRLRNDGPTALRFDGREAQLEVRTEDDRVWVVERPVKIIGNTEVLPRATERLELIYALPPGVTVADLLGYELLWAVETDQARVSRSTPFVRERHSDYPGYYYRPYYPFYYPYYPYFGGYGPDPWGWHFGAGTGFGW